MQAIKTSKNNLVLSYLFHTPLTSLPRGPLTLSNFYMFTCLPCLLFLPLDSVSPSVSPLYLHTPSLYILVHLLHKL